MHFKIIILLFCVMLKLSKTEFNLTVFHINNFHSKWLEFDEKNRNCSFIESSDGKCFGGFSRLVSAVRHAREQESNVLVLSSGDFFSEDSFLHENEWRLASEAVSYLTLDAMGISRNGISNGLFELMAMEFPTVCANLAFENNSRVDRSVILTIGSEKIAVIGYINDDGRSYLSKGVNVSLVPEIVAVQTEIKNVVEKGINKIIVISDSTYDNDVDVAKKANGTDLVLGNGYELILYKAAGLTHFNDTAPHLQVSTFNPTDSKPSEKTPIAVHLPQDGKHVGLLRLTFDDQGSIIHSSGKSLLLDKTYPQDRDSLRLLKSQFHLENSVQQYLPDVTSGIELNGDRCHCRMYECTLGNFITDAMLHWYDKQYKKNLRLNLTKYHMNHRRHESHDNSYVNAAVIRSKSIWRSVSLENVTSIHLGRALSLEEIVKRNMTGKELKDMMEGSVSRYDVAGVSPPGSFLQVGGMKVAFSLNNPPGSRVRSLEIRCKKSNGKVLKPVQANKTYIIAMPSSLMRCLDGFKRSDVEDKYLHSSGNGMNLGQIVMSMMLSDYLYEIIIHKLHPKVEGRIIFDVDSNTVQPDTISEASNSSESPLPCKLEKYSDQVTPRTVSYIANTTLFVTDLSKFLTTVAATEEDDSNWRRFLFRSKLFGTERPNDHEVMSNGSVTKVWMDHITNDTIFVTDLSKFSSTRAPAEEDENNWGKFWSHLNVFGTGNVKDSDASVTIEGSDGLESSRGTSLAGEDAFNTISSYERGSSSVNSRDVTQKIAQESDHLNSTTESGSSESSSTTDQSFQKSTSPEAQTMTKDCSQNDSTVTDESAFRSENNQTSSTNPFNSSTESMLGTSARSTDHPSLSTSGDRKDSNRTALGFSANSAEPAVTHPSVSHQNSTVKRICNHSISDEPTSVYAASTIRLDNGSVPEGNLSDSYVDPNVIEDDEMKHELLDWQPEPFWLFDDAYNGTTISLNKFFDEGTSEDDYLNNTIDAGGLKVPSFTKMIYQLPSSTLPSSNDSLIRVKLRKAVIAYDLLPVDFNIFATPKGENSTGVIETITSITLPKDHTLEGNTTVSVEAA